tara:strand:+ start:990 stop:1376 length:387 start_codon:yes stop_codon:yes gene_type:complete
MVSALSLFAEDALLAMDFSMDIAELMIPDPEDNRRWMLLASLFGLFIYMYIFTREERASVRFLWSVMCYKTLSLCVCVLNLVVVIVIIIARVYYALAKEIFKCKMKAKKGVPNEDKLRKKKLVVTHVI